MGERPILFSAPMVRAILAGTKTQTRRIVDLERLRVRLPYEVRGDLPEVSRLLKLPVRRAKPGTHPATMNPHGAVAIGKAGQLLGVKPGEFDFVCPYAVGTTRLVGGVWTIEPHGENRLWVREGIRRDAEGELSHFIADGAPTKADCWPWKNKALPAIHCPRGLSRLTLEVTGVRVERLQDISEEDAKAEGLAVLSKDGGRLWKYGIADRDGLPGDDDDGWHWQDWDKDPRKAYARLWDQINGAGSWAKNPWVWCVEFRRAPAQAREGARMGVEG